MPESWSGNVGIAVTLGDSLAPICRRPTPLRRAACHAQAYLTAKEEAPCDSSKLIYEAKYDKSIGLTRDCVVTRPESVWSINRHRIALGIPRIGRHHAAFCPCGASVALGRGGKRAISLEHDLRAVSHLPCDPRWIGTGHERHRRERTTGLIGFALANSCVGVATELRIAPICLTDLSCLFFGGFGRRSHCRAASFLIRRPPRIPSS